MCKVPLLNVVCSMRRGFLLFKYPRGLLEEFVSIYYKKHANTPSK